jgi:hypothetical protein
MILIKLQLLLSSHWKKNHLHKKERKKEKKKSVKIIRCSMLLHGLFGAPVSLYLVTPQKLQHILVEWEQWNNWEEWNRKDWWWVLVSTWNEWSCKTGDPISRLWKFPLSFSSNKPKPTLCSMFHSLFKTGFQRLKAIT